MMANLKILLGGIPLGCDNIGDEAILATVVAMFRKNFPGVKLTVCTDHPEETARWLGVSCAPLYGFKPGLPLQGFSKLAAEHDLYCWCGATGLSDYPDTALNLLRAARLAGVPTMVWGVGMDSTFNPAFFTFHGRRRTVLRWAGLGLVDLISLGERFLRWRIRRRIRRELELTRLVVLRDPESNAVVKQCGFHRAVAGADTAILLPSGDSPILREPGIRKIGFCISAQRQVTDLAEMTRLWRRLTEQGNTRLVLIPMNPKTDRELMAKLSRELDQSKIEWVNSTLPEVIQAAAANCDILVSSRLHLLILGSNVMTPLIGIERGSKLPNFLANFGLTPAGTVFHCDFRKIESEIERFSSDGGTAFRETARQGREQLLKRLAQAETLLIQTIQKLKR